MVYTETNQVNKFSCFGVYLRLRVVTYNLLAHAYSDTATAKIHFYPYCEQEYLDFKYRRVLLTHELMSELKKSMGESIQTHDLTTIISIFQDYNADIVFLQECDETFFENELTCILGSQGYLHFIKLKGDAREGEAILFRKDRFR